MLIGLPADLTWYRLLTDWGSVIGGVFALIAGGIAFMGALWAARTQVRAIFAGIERPAVFVEASGHVGTPATSPIYPLLNTVFTITVVCETSCRYRAVFLTVIDSQAPDLCAAQGMRPFQYRVEQWPKIAGRRIDDAEHLSRRGLLLQRLARLRDEPRILHRNDRLRCEIL